MNESSLAEDLRDLVQKFCNKRGELLGEVGLVGDVVLLFEAHLSEMTLLRHFDTGVPSWRQLGILESARQTLHTEEITGGFCGPCGRADSPS